ncbi:glycosyltransferase family 4 protein [Roseococcus sp. DSY-14]|uniref:glycosyltransferase family 4 protein n=1 Tax=Roseococcus sp. DSY-14 TaxID=3369650 RepID=UPI00387A99C3
MLDGRRIWLDGFPLSHPMGTGISTYARGFARDLAAIGARPGVLLGRILPERADAAEREVRLFDAGAPANRPLAWRLWRMATEPRGAQARPVPEGVVDRATAPAGAIRHFTPGSLPRGAELWNAPDIFGRSWLHLALTGRFLPVRVRGPAPAAMHWMQPHPLAVPGVPNIHTLHDLIPLRLPWSNTDHKRLWLRTVRGIARHADHILAVSEHTRREAISLLGVAEERITTTWQAIPPPLPMAGGGLGLARLRQALGLEPGGYWLFLSTVEPRKNIPRLLDAYYASGSARPLVIVGQKGLFHEEQLRLLTEAGGTRTPDGMVRHLGYLPRLDVDTLLRHARALLFPSLHEGFGLPVAEAMQLGTPVLASTTSSLPEVAGDAALLVDPTDTRAIAEGIRALDADDALRGRLGAAGPTQAATFSPERHQARLLAVHRRLGLAG